MGNRSGNGNERLLRFLQATPEQQAAIDRVLSGMGEPAKAEELGPVWIRVRTAAVMLDAHRATVWRMVKAGRLTAREILPGSFRVRRAEVEALANAGVVGPAQEPMETAALKEAGE